MSVTREELLKEFDEEECEKDHDSHPFLHELIVDYLLEHFELVRK